MSASRPDIIAPRSATPSGLDSHGPYSATPTEETAAHLSELVRCHKVCWAFWPQYVAADSHRQQAGHALELSAAHEDGVKHVLPGCPGCQQVCTALHEIVAHILPRDDRPSVYDLSSDDHAVHYSPIRGDRPDLCLTIGIFHRGNIDDPVGQCQERCFAEMKRRLLALGARERQWTTRRGDQR